MESFDLIIVEQAIIEMENACEFYNVKVDGLGAKFSEEIFELLNKILINPLLFPVKFKQIHEAVLLRFPFVITYEIIENKVIVLSIFHTKRNPKEKSKTRNKPQ